MPNPQKLTQTRPKTHPPTPIHAPVVPQNPPPPKLTSSDIQFQLLVAPVFDKTSSPLGVQTVSDPPPAFAESPSPNPVWSPWIWQCHSENELSIHIRRIFSHLDSLSNNLQVKEVSSVVLRHYFIQKLLRSWYYESRRENIFQGCNKSWIQWTLSKNKCHWGSYIKSQVNYIWAYNCLWGEKKSRLSFKTSCWGKGQPLQYLFTSMEHENLKKCHFPKSVRRTFRVVHRPVFPWLQAYTYQNAKFFSLRTKMEHIHEVKLPFWSQGQVCSVWKCTQKYPREQSSNRGHNRVQRIQWIRTRESHKFHFS